MAERARFEFQTDSDTKMLAERAAAASGCSSVSELMTRLIRDHAPSILEQTNTITLMNENFDRFAQACSAPPRPLSKNMLEAAKRLDTEGF